MKKRESSIDLYRGFLILLVVIGHYQRDLIHDVIFLFHMPLFFIISGMLLQKENLLSSEYLGRKIHNLMFPYVVYLFIDFAIFKHSFDIVSVVKVLWGGRALSGTYWYITCFIGVLFLFGFLLKHFSDKTTKCLILAGGVLQ